MQCPDLKTENKGIADRRDRVPPHHEPEIRDKARPHPSPMASQARHKSVSRETTSASRYVVPQEREKHSALPIVNRGVVNVRSVLSAAQTAAMPPGATNSRKRRSLAPSSRGRGPA